jgi:CO/xanthine dehydrogenase FAD-binding subunit
MGSVFSDQAIRLAGDALLEIAAFRSSARRASAEYRRDLAGDLLHHALEAAWRLTWE